MSEQHPNDPLHGVTLRAILEDLVARHGWSELGERIEIRCFLHDPSINSSLKFLRRIPWARAKVERLYLESQELDRDSSASASRAPSALPGKRGEAP